MMLQGLFSGSDVNLSKAHVEVRDMQECAMSFYDGFPAVAVKFFKRVRKERMWAIECRLISLQLLFSLYIQEGENKWE